MMMMMMLLVRSVMVGRNDATQNYTHIGRIVVGIQSPQRNGRWWWTTIPLRKTTTFEDPICVGVTRKKNRFLGVPVVVEVGTVRSNNTTDVQNDDAWDESSLKTKIDSFSKTKNEVTVSINRPSCGLYVMTTWTCCRVGTYRLPQCRYSI
jgi:hypothetical protein